MKCTTVVTLSLVLATLLSSCGSRTETELDYTKVTTPAALAADAESALGTKYDTFTVACTVPDTSAFAEQYYHINYDWNVWTSDECVSKIEAILEMEGKAYDKTNLTVTNQAADYYGTAVGAVSEYSYTSDASVVGIATSAYRTKYIREPVLSIQTDTWEQVDRYYINQGDAIDGVSYLLDGQDYALTDAVSVCDEYVSKLKDILGFESASLRKVLVYQIQEDEDGLNAGDYVYFIFYEKTIEGAGLNYDCSTLWNQDIPYMDEPSLFFYVAKPGIVSYWSDQREKHITSEEKLDGVLPLSYALEKIDSEVATYSNYTVSSVELSYAALEWQWDSSTFYYEPYWCIRLATGQTDGGISNFQWDPCTMAYVNAVSGECYIVSTIPGGMLGTDQYFENPDWDPTENPESQWRVKQ